jgi:hypothetical protein
VLVVPVGAFKSAIVKIGKTTTRLEPAVSAFIEPITLEFSAKPVQPVRYEFVLPTPANPGAKSPVTVLFKGANNLVTELPQTVGGKVASVAIAESGTVEVVNRPSSETPRVIDEFLQNPGELRTLEIGKVNEIANGKITDSWGDCRLTFTTTGPIVKANKGKNCTATAKGTLSTLSNGIELGTSSEGSCMIATPLVLTATSTVASLLFQQTLFQQSSVPIVTTTTSPPVTSAGQPTPAVAVDATPVFLDGFFPDPTRPWNAIDFSLCSQTGTLEFSDTADRQKAFTLSW